MPYNPPSLFPSAEVDVDGGNLHDLNLTVTEFRVPSSLNLAFSSHTWPFFWLTSVNWLCLGSA